MAVPPYTNATAAIIHCERCGVATVAGTTEFCLACGLYVCAACWSQRVLRCSECRQPLRRPSFITHVRTLRRWDRRLREVIRDLDSLERTSGSGSPPSDEFNELACLLIKAGAVDRAGEAALARLPPTRRARGVVLLIQRIRRHAASAESGLARLTEGLWSSAAAPVQSRQVEADGVGLGLRRRVSPVVAGAAAAVLLAVVLGAAWLDPIGLGNQRTGEGVLGGDPAARGIGVGTPTTKPTNQAEVGVPPPPSEAAASAQLINFDAVRMGSGIGEGWAGSDGGEVTLVAFPTGVDRSARLVAREGQPTTTCRPIKRGVRKIGFDLILDADIPAGAVVELRDRTSDPVLTLLVSETRTVVSIAERVVERRGVKPARWYRIEVVDREPGVKWQLELRDGKAARPVEAVIDDVTLGNVSEICLKADGPDGGAVNYDNLAITTTNR